MLMAEPVSIFSGSIHRDWAAVEKRVAQGGCGGLYGWVGFDGEFLLGEYLHVLRYDHDAGHWWQQGQAVHELVAPTAERQGRVAPLDFTPQVSRQQFIDAVCQAQAYIAAGDIYQVNLSHPWQASWPAEADVLAMYLRLREVSPAPHSACLDWGEIAVLSASPELFLKMDGRTIVTRPIKGTRPRFPEDPVRDAMSARELPLCEKERAELLMITDLERNDLGQVCDFGTVQTTDLWKVEAFAQVYHLVSTVTGTLRAEVSHAAAFRACFPGGSISGAPKKRALEIIAELEPWPRGLYTGAIGGFGFDGSSQWSIAIRTAIRRGTEVTFHAGSGIVADSIPECEWEETLHKASGLLRAWQTHEPKSRR
jgi:anthranilate/para-aminobenzoate synthase component I